MSFGLNALKAVLERYTGFYSKKGCIETATNIGKELIDLQNSGKTLTTQDLLDAIKENAPHIKPPNIATTKDEFISLMQKNKVNELEQRYATKTIIESENIMGIFGYLIKGIFIKSENIPKGKIPAVLSHELEHFMEYYNNPQTAIKRVFSLSNIKRRFGKNKTTEKLKNVKDKEKYIKNIIAKRPKTFPEETLIEFFGADSRKFKHINTGMVEGYEPTVKGIMELLKSPIYKGLTNEKRIDAYIRAILRHNFHPLKTSPQKLKALKNHFAKEATAYEVSDNILRYELGKEGITSAKIRSEVCKRATKILDNEIKIAKSPKGHKKPAHQTGLPKSAVVE